MAKAVSCKIYFTDVNTAPSTVPTNLTFIESRYLFFPVNYGGFPSTATEIVNSAGLQTSNFSLFEAAIPEFELISTFYNWTADPSNYPFFDWFPQIHNYYPNYISNMILFEFINPDGTTYGYMLAKGGSTSNPRTTFYTAQGTSIVTCVNLLAGGHGILVSEDGDTFTNVYCCQVLNGSNVRVRVVNTTEFTGGTKQDVLDFLNGLPLIQPTNDPYEEGGSSGTGGGTGTFSGTGDDIDFPSLPTLSAVDTGFITIFNPSSAQLKSLANYMWGDLFDIDTWKKIFADPMDAILGMSIVPVEVPNGGGANVTVGNISTGIAMNKAAAQYVEVDCGTLNIDEFWGAYLDYDPYTKAEIYLPYIGTHPMAVDDIMGKSVHVKYHVDILSGSCCAYVKCGSSVLYSFVGHCSCSIPITGNDWTNVVNGALSIAASIGTMVATGGASAPMAATTIASTAVNSMKPNVEKSGALGGMGGMLGVQTPYIILTRPRQALPASQNSFMGYPSFITMLLGDCVGYTEIESIHLENIPATEQELSEIESLLKGGVIL